MTNDDDVRLLHDALFHAWVAIGEWLERRDKNSADQREDFLACYALLTDALRAVKRPRTEV